MKYISCQGSTSNREPMLFKSIHVFCVPRMILAMCCIFWGQGFCFQGTWTLCLVRKCIGGPLIWVPGMINISSSLILRPLVTLVTFTGGETEALSWWQCQNHNPSLPTSGLYEFFCRFSCKWQCLKPAREKQNCAFSQYMKALRKICPAKHCGGKG